MSWPRASRDLLLSCLGWSVPYLILGVGGAWVIGTYPINPSSAHPIALQDLWPWELWVVVLACPLGVLLALAPTRRRVLRTAVFAMALGALAYPLIYLVSSTTLLGVVVPCAVVPIGARLCANVTSKAPVVHGSS